MANLSYVGSVLFRVISRTKHMLDGSHYTSYGLVIPKEAAVRLGWRPGQRVDMWVDEDRRILIVAATPRATPPALP